MGIPGLIRNAIGTGERIALSNLAVTHLERTRRPIRIAVDISIWLFQVQAGKGGQNPELRTLFFRLVRLLALPIHPLFVYDGQHKPPFKRGKSTAGRSYGSAPIIHLSKKLIDLFKFPRHDAPGEAEAECARLQQEGIVDAVMSDDVDALMFGSTLTVMNFSRETTARTSGPATHVDCYRLEDIHGMTKNVGLSRAGMILFALLSGGDYLPSGIPKCGGKLAAEIARAGFGEDLLELWSSGQSLDEWRQRLQYELEENESGYFQHKHKAVKIPDDFPDPTILGFYAKPIVSSDEQIERLRHRLEGAWDQEIDVLKLRQFVAEAFDWKYVSGARKVIRMLAEPLVSYRLRLGQPVVARQFSANRDVPVMQRVYRNRKHFSTGGLSQLQLEMIPVDVVGIDLDLEEPNPPMSQSTHLSSQSQKSQSIEEAGDEEEAAEEELVTEPAIERPKRRYSPYEPEKIWVFETVARIGIPEVVDRWEQEQAEKAAPKPKKTPRPRKKKPIDPTMRPGEILRYATVTKPGSELIRRKQQLLEAAMAEKSVNTSAAPSAQKKETRETLTSPSSPASNSAKDQTSGEGRPARREHTHRPHPALGSCDSPILLDSDDDAPSGRASCSYTTSTGSPKPRRTRRQKSETHSRRPRSRSSTPTPAPGANRQRRQTAGKNTAKHSSPSPPPPPTDEILDPTIDDFPSRRASSTPIVIHSDSEPDPSQPAVTPRPEVPGSPVLTAVEENTRTSQPSSPEQRQSPKKKKKMPAKPIIKTKDGFWTVEYEEESGDPEDGLIPLQSEEDEKTNDGGNDQGKGARKKKIGRVSLIDLT